MKRNKLFIIVFVFFILYLFNNIYATDIFSNTNEENKNLEQAEQSVTDNASEMYNLDEFIQTINESVKENVGQEIDFTKLTQEILDKNNINHKNLILKLVELFAREVSSAIKGVISIFIIIVIMAIITNLELEKKSDITNIAHLACFIVIATIAIATFIQSVDMLKSTVKTMTTLMQVISPFLLTILIATGSITTTGIIQPLLLFLAGFVGFVITYFVIPLLSISVAFNTICSISENIRLEKLSKIFSSASIWSIGVILTVFLGVLSLETSISSSVDALGVKTTQAAVANFVPVVGKFFSDSFEVVVGATKIIGKIGGVIGIIGLVVVAAVPILKFACIMGIYMLLAAFIEPICTDNLISNYLSSFVNVYKTMLGVLIGVAILFIISTGIILNLVSNIIV